MKNEQTAKIAEILGVTVENIYSMPVDILDSMQNVLECIEVNNEDDAKMLYSELENYRIKGTVLHTLYDMARDTGISVNTLKSLDFDTQKELAYEYLADSSNTNLFFEIINKALAVMEINTVAKLIGVSAVKLKELPYDTQVQLCGIYAMENDIYSEFELINHLKGGINYE